MDIVKTIFDDIPAELDVISEKKPSIDYISVSYIKSRDVFVCLGVYTNERTFTRDGFKKKITSKYKTYWRG